MRTFKHTTAAVAVLIIMLSLTVGAYAAMPNLAEWNQCDMYTVLESGGISNSAVDCIILRVKPEKDVNRVRFLFMINMTGFDDEQNAGINLDFGNYGSVELMCDGTSDYDTDVFFAEIDSIVTDKYSHLLALEITVGFKQGIPENPVFDMFVYDTEGVASNTYTVDISDSISENGEDDIEADETEKTAKTRTTKVKTTKVKTTKVKTTKVKTTKNKTTKAKTTKVKTEKSDNFENTNEVLADEFEDIQTENDKNKLIIISAAAITACAAGGCTMGIINSRKKNGRGDK